MSSINLILLYGGKSSEHEISLRSAASVLHQLNPNKYKITPIAIDKNGQYFINDAEELRQCGDSLPIQTKHSKPLSSIINNGRLAVPAEVVFPMLHGPLYEDGCIQGLLKLANVAFVGCDILSSAMGMDKDIARRVACLTDIKHARYRSLQKTNSATALQNFCQEVIQDLGFPLFVKPCNLGSSVGIHKALNLMELQTAIADAFRYDEEILVEEFIQGREIELAVLENLSDLKMPLVSEAGEIKILQQNSFYSYAAKYVESNSTHLIAPVELPAAVIEQLQKHAADIFLRLKCKGMARIDFFVNPENYAIYFNEINTLPGFTSISMYPRLWEVSGLNYANLLDKLINLALHHHNERQKIITSYQ